MVTVSVFHVSFQGNILSKAGMNNSLNDKRHGIHMRTYRLYFFMFHAQIFKVIVFIFYIFINEKKHKNILLSQCKFSERSLRNCNLLKKAINFFITHTLCSKEEKKKKTKMMLKCKKEINSVFLSEWLWCPQNSSLIKLNNIPIIFLIKSFKNIKGIFKNENKIFKWRVGLNFVVKCMTSSFIDQYNLNSLIRVLTNFKHGKNVISLNVLNFFCFFFKKDFFFLVLKQEISLTRYC